MPSLKSLLGRTPRILLKIVIPFCALGVAAGYAAAASAKPAASASPAEAPVAEPAGAAMAEVRRLDAARVEALVRSDHAALKGIFQADAVYTHSSGKVESGVAYLQRLEQGELRYLAMRYEVAPAVRLQGKDVAVVSGRVQLTAQGKTGTPNERTLASTAVYARTDAGWRLISFQSTPAPAAPRFQLLGQHLAVKEACAWPKLVRHPDGTIYAAIYDQPAHGAMVGDTACWASKDGGLTWEFRGNATKHEGNQALFNHAIGLAANGDLLVTASGWNYRSEGGGKTQIPLVPIVSRSSDGGRTWRVIGRFPNAPEAGKEFVPFGNIERGADGALRVAAYSYARGMPLPRVDPGYAITSTDDGVTWEVGPLIGTPEVNETDILHMGKGRWLAAARNLGGPARESHSIDLYVSEDDSRTWRLMRRLTGRGQHPGDLLKLADGRILLTYGDRRGAQSGVNAMVSADGGVTWSPEFRVASGLASNDSGYPSSVQIADGTIVTAYYAKGSEQYSGYQMGVVRWRLEP